MPAVAADDALYAGQTDAHAFELVGAMQSLEGGEEAIGVGHVEAHAVVFDYEGRLLLLENGAEPDPGRVSRSCEFPGICEEILQHYRKQCGVTAHDHPLLDVDLHPAVRFGQREPPQDAPGLGAQIHRLRHQLAAGQAREVEQGVDDPPQAPGSRGDPGQMLAAHRVQAVGVLLQQDLGEAGNVRSGPRRSWEIE